MTSKRVASLGAPKSGAKRHHYISQCYLRGFVADLASPRLFVTDFEVPKQFCASPVDVALAKNFHTIDIPGQPPDIVEKKLAEFESDLGPALRRIVEARSLSDEHDRSVLFFFMALLTIKNPRMRQTIGNFMGSSAEMMMKMKASDAKVWAAEMARAKAGGTIPQDSDTDQLRNLVLQGAFGYNVSTSGHLHLEFNLVDKILPYFHSRKWMLYYTSKADAAAFITSDNPVSLMWQERKKTEPPGLGRRGTDIVFAVSNELTIIGSFEGSSGAVEADDELLAIINGDILPYATRQVYARGDDFVYARPHNAGTKRGSELLDDPMSAA